MPRLVCDPFNYAPYVIVQGLNLGGDQNGSRGEQLGLSSESICRIFNVIYIEDSPRQFDALLVLTPTIANFRNDCPFIRNQRLSSFNNCGGPHDTFFRMTLPH